MHTHTNAHTHVHSSHLAPQPQKEKVHSAQKLHIRSVMQMGSRVEVVDTTSTLYIYTRLISPLKGDGQDKVFRVQGDFTFPFLSAPCIFVGENTEKGLPRPLTKPFVKFYNLQFIIGVVQTNPIP